jgi:dTDP-4-amino-4,6-dideoxygalactose transaminase
MEGMQGAILRVKLRHLGAWTEARRSHAATYSKLLSGSGIKTPVAMDYAYHVYHVYGVQVPHRDMVQQALQKEEVQTGIHYPIPVHMLEAYADLGYKPGDFPRSEQIANNILSLPMFAELTDEQIKIVTQAISKFTA